MGHNLFIPTNWVWSWRTWSDGTLEGNTIFTFRGDRILSGYQDFHEGVCMTEMGEFLYVLKIKILRWLDN